MPKNSKSQNAIDRNRVMDRLLRDPGCTVQTLADDCNLSTQQVYRILRHLEEEGIVYGNPMMIDLSKVGKKRFIIFATRSGRPSDQSTLNGSLYSKVFLEEMREKNLDIIPEDDYTCTGAFDMVTIFLANNATDANKYLDLLRHVSNDYFSTFRISEVLFTTRKNMIATPERKRFIEYVKDISEYGSRLKDPEELEEYPSDDEDE
ncbi:winged helix-turn-helix transcriptional regulator [Methanomassiliicoccales archaeon LGM-RCC1]|nr:winged helix-turn-helix transcriptional regulator [Methanomassiliicoccales archaeon LGM-RCC1]